MAEPINGLRALIEKHVSTLVREGMVAVIASKELPPDIQAVKDAAHKVKGSGGSCGFSELSATALEAERHFAKLILEQGQITQESRDIIDRLEIVLNELSPEKSSLYQI